MDAAQVLIRLLKCAWKNEELEKTGDEIALEQAYELAKYHCVEVMAYDALNRQEQKRLCAEAGKPGNEWMDAWKKRRQQAFLMNLTQLSEAERIFAGLEEAQIPFLPLKGYWMKQMYPKPDFRQMADLDILIEPELAEKAHGLMGRLGYRCEAYGKSDTDSYFMAPYVHVELHKRLIPPDRTPYAEYFERCWEKADAEEGYSYRYRMKWEDFYVYMTGHFAKHYFSSGSGIRSVMDFYVFTETFGDQLDWKYISGELEKTGLREFEADVQALSRVWFDGQEPTEKTWSMEDYILHSGTYGNVKNRVGHGLMDMSEEMGSVRRAKIRYLRSRLLPELSFMKTRYAILEKWPVLLPVFYVVRLGYSVLFRGRRMAAEWGAWRGWRRDE